MPLFLFCVSRRLTPSALFRGEFASVRAATAMCWRHEIPDRYDYHQGQTDVHQVRRPPVAEQPTVAANTMAGPIMPSRLRSHCRWLNQSSAFARKASAANSRSRRLMNRPSYWLRKPSPMAAPKLALLTVA